MAYFISASDVFSSFKKREISRPAAPALGHLLQTAPPLYGHRLAEHPSVALAINCIYIEIAELFRKEKKRIKEPKKFLKHVRVIVLDLWAASTLSTNPYRSISLNKTFYQKSTRYQRLFLKYDYVSKSLKALEELGYIEIQKGYRYRSGGDKGFNTRIKATDSLLSKIKEGAYVSGFKDEGSDECIVLHDADKKRIEYTDSPKTILMRRNLTHINAELDKALVALYMSDSKWEEFYSFLSTNKRRTINFLDKRMHRVFNETFDRGGRFYGGWWIEVPKIYRKYIEIDHKPTVELDYSGHHYRILYGMTEVPMEGDPYEIHGFPRQAVKESLLIMLNAASSRSALNALRNEQIKDAKELMNAAEKRHAPIARYFYSGKGLELQRRDSEIAERVMLRMLERGAIVLPVHDSFIVKNSYDIELREVMAEEFKKEYGESGITAKPTMLDEVEVRGATYSEYHRLFH